MNMTAFVDSPARETRSPEAMNSVRDHGFRTSDGVAIRNDS